MKIIKWLLWAVIVTVLTSSAVFAAEGTEGSFSGIDAIIVVDTSNSMKSTDPGKISIEAAKMFIDMMEANGSRVGIVGFSSQINKSVPLTNLSNQQDKKDLQNILDSLAFTGETDMGLALKEANRLLTEGTQSSNKKMILFFTDGKIEFFSDKGENGRTIEASLTDVETVLSQVNESFPIYTIGLNANGNVDTSLIQTIADRTKARNYIVNSASELPDIFNGIFADFVKSNIINVGDFTTDGVNDTIVSIDIPNDSVAEANIVMLSTDTLQKVTLTDPDGAEVASDGQKLVTSISKSYSMLKIIAPKQGSWTLRIKGNPSCEVHVNMLFNYDIDLVMELKPTDENQQTHYTIGSSVPISGFFISEQGKIEDKAFYDLFQASAVVTSPDGNTAQMPMTDFYTELPITQLGEYKIYIRADGESFYRTTKEQVLTIGNASPHPSDLVPETLSLKSLFLSGAKKEINLSEWFIDEDSDTLSYEINLVSGREYLEAELTEGELFLKGSKKGEASLVIKVTDGLGGTAEITVPVVVSYTFQNRMPLILGLIAVILLLVTAIYGLRIWNVKNTPFYGGVDYYVERETIVGLPQEQHKRLAGKKGNLKLSKIIQIPEAKQMEFDKIAVYPHFSKRNGIRIVNHSKCELSAGFGKKGVSILLFDGESCNINCDLGNKSLSVCVTYRSNSRG